MTYSQSQDVYSKTSPRSSRETLAPCGCSHICKRCHGQAGLFVGHITKAFPIQFPRHNRIPINDLDWFQILLERSTLFYYSTVSLAVYLHRGGSHCEMALLMPYLKLQQQQSSTIHSHSKFYKNDPEEQTALKAMIGFSPKLKSLP
jgi:hypothetical protein